ncbi:MAG: hypothetical protein LBO76_07410 [Treponema sp.]|jgi:hypothetical protein|nr:hypothetical protein [Treponema sp.]
MYKLCSQVLGREAGLLQRIAEAQKKVRDAVVRREWADFDSLLAAIGRIAGELEGLEAERQALFGRLPGFSGLPDGEAGFFRFAASLPPEGQKEMAAKYRELKMAALRIRINNENLLAYVAGIKATMSAFIESAFPDRRGRVYSRSGAVMPQDMRCMVLNRSL